MNKADMPFFKLVDSALSGLKKHNKTSPPLPPQKKTETQHPLKTHHNTHTHTTENKQKTPNKHYFEIMCCLLAL